MLIYDIDGNIISSDEYDDIPSYFTDQLDSAIATARENMISAGIDGDTFIFFSDSHWLDNSKHSAVMMKKIVDKLNITKIISGGDIITVAESRATAIGNLTDFVNSYKNITNFYVLFGNHDRNSYQTSSSDYLTRTNNYVLEQKQGDNYIEMGEPCYFYFDNKTTKTRFICLDTGDIGSALSSAQKAWFTNTLNSTPSGYHILIFAHIIYGTTTSWHVGLLPSELAISSAMSSICTECDTFNENHNDTKIEAFFGGHVHIDCDFTTSGGIPIVLIDCDTKQTFTETSPGSGVANHAVGTINEQAFDIVTIDYTNSTIKCVRVGRGSDRVMTY